MSKDAAIVWLRKDLRLLDNSALFEAYKNYDIVILLYIKNTDPLDRPMGGASQWWLHYALSELQTRLISKNTRIIFKYGDAFQIFKEIIKEVEAKAVFFNRNYEPYYISFDQKIAQYCKSLHVEVHQFKGNIINEPFDIKNKQGNNFKVFSHYWRTCLTVKTDQTNYNIPNIKPLLNSPSSLSLEDLKLLPQTIDWAKGLKKTWKVSEKKALATFNDFVKNDLIDYKDKRNLLDDDHTSQLSPYIHFGQISVNYMLTRLNFLASKSIAYISPINKFISELGWRDFSYYLLYYYPQLVNENYKKKFDHFEYSHDPSLLRAWHKGLTGYPMIDAGMRQLREIGWIPNRIRMIVASFLTKNLLTKWKKGEEWFWDNLVDADIANNMNGWQWVSGSGIDSSPYFRIFNPTLGGEKFDKTGGYVRRWVPEIKNIPNKFIHKPWKLSDSMLKEFAPLYHKPIVNYSEARVKALKLYRELKSY